MPKKVMPKSTVLPQGTKVKKILTLEEGSLVTVTTQYRVRRMLEPAANGASLVTVTDKYDDRTVTFRREELKLIEENRDGQ